MKTEHYYSSRQHSSLWVWITILFIALCFGLLKMHVISNDFWDAFFSWPLILLVIGIFQLRHLKISESLILFVAAVFFWIPFFKSAYPDSLWIFSNTHFYKQYWWILFCVIALIMIVKHILIGTTHNERFYYRKSCTHASNGYSRTTTSNDYEHSETAFTSKSKKNTSQDYRGGLYEISFANQIIDLSEAHFNEETTPIIKLQIAFASCKIYMPKECQVELKVNNCFASVNDDRSYICLNHHQKIEITGSITFGSIQILN